MAYNPFAGRYAAVDNPSEEFRFNDLAADRRQSDPSQGPLSPPVHALYSPNAVYSQNTSEPYRDVTTAYGGPGSTEYSPQPNYKYQTQRPVSIGSTWSGYENDERAWNELPSDVQGIQTRPSWVQPPVESADLNPYRVSFDRSKQLRKLLISALLRWAITLGIIILIVVTLYFYSHMMVMQSTAKRIFNTIITGLSISLGLNMASAFKAQALAARWKILARRPHSAKMLDHILNLDSLTTTCKLIIKPSAYMALRVGLALWILFNIGTQIATALLGLAYELNGFQSNTEFNIGPVTVPMLEEFIPGWNRTPIVQGNNQFISHLYGDIASSFVRTQIDPVLNLNDRSIYNFDATRQNFTYRFRDRVPNDKTRFTFTNRTISTSSSCATYPVLSNMNGLEDEVEVRFPDGPLNISLPAGGGVNTVHYIFPGLNAFGYCGERCSTIEVFQPINSASNDNTAHFYFCNVTVTNITNPYLPEHYLSDLIAQLAAAAISLSGFADTTLPRGEQIESVRYLASSYYGSPATSDPVGIQSLISEYAIGVIAAMGELNLRTHVTGQVPLQGVQLSVNWGRCALILALLGGGQLLLTLAIAFWSSSVIVRDESYLATARILRPLVEPFGRYGCAVDGDIIAKSFKEPLLYGVRTLNTEMDTIHHLEIGPGKDIRLKSMNWFPEGKYD